MKNAILRTLLYADLFDYPLTKEEIWKWLVVKNSKFEENLSGLIKNRKIETREDLYFLPGREFLVSIRNMCEQSSEPKIKIAHRVVKTFRLIPWIKLIGITGSLAVKNSEEKDDIDLFFITSQNRLWLTRGLVVIILRMQGRYRRPNKITNMICPNMFISEGSMEISPQNLFMAHEICQLVPIFERDNTYLKFIVANSWVENYLPNAYRGITPNINAEKYGKPNFSVVQRLVPRSSAIESAAMRVQLWYMRKNRTTEIVSQDLIKFHPHNLEVEIMKKYQNLLKLI